jgi:hypothetical protein
MSDDRKTRAATAGLSAVGATAGAAGLAYAGHKTSQAYRNARRLYAPTRRAALKSAIRHEKFGTALIPLEVAGLGGELMATKILHADAKKPKEPVVAKSIGIAQSNGHGRRLDGDVAKAAPAQLLRAAEKTGVMVKKPKPTEGVAQLRRRYNASLENALNAKTGTVVKRKGDRRSAERELGGFGVGLGAATALGTVGDNGLNRAFTGHSLPKKVLGRRLGGSAAAAGAGGALIAHSRRQAKVDKARRYDPEADRQRRLGAYAGLAGGGAIVAGERAGRELASTRVVGRGAQKGLVARHVGFKPGRTKAGLALSAATAGLGAIALGSAKRGVSERNQTWT